MPTEEHYEPPNTPIPKPIRFLFGGVAGCTSSAIMHPLDFLKFRMQMSGEGGKTKKYNNIAHAAKLIVRKEGFFALYNGLSASLLRQLCYTSVRMGVYTSVLDYLTNSGETNPSFLTKMGCGMLGGIAGAVAGNPADVALVRMALDGKRPAAERRNYGNVLKALSHIARSEGPTKLFVGLKATVMRAMIVNTSQLVTYSEVKNRFIQRGIFEDNIFCHFWSSMVSAVVVTLSSMPVDIVKTRMQNAEPGSTETIVGVFARTIKQEGFFALWKGTTPAYIRIGPTTVIILVVYEHITKLYKKYVLGEDSGGGL